MSLPHPYATGDGWTLYHGDCLEILPLLEADAVVTDPPFDGYTEYEWGEVQWSNIPAEVRGGPGLWFWKGRTFPLEWTARHVWSKANRNIGPNAEQYEDIYEVGGTGCGLVFRHAVIDSEMNATLNGDVFMDHPCQKPVKLLRRLVCKYHGMILDPFTGSGTTGVACIQTGRRFIGVEIEERYCEIAAKRMRAAEQEVSERFEFAKPKVTQLQLEPA
ncbi:MAG: site-specific DNA-methyltransferase [Actinobacteria bacterium]|nr:MAG: site-specific DNA-methyltransferase [Actinomycetota bacterium]